MSDQLRRLNKNVDIIVGTPGRIIDHIKRKSLDLSKITHLVLDEADEMLNMGFRITSYNVCYTKLLRW